MNKTIFKSLSIILLVITLILGSYSKLLNNKATPGASIKQLANKSLIAAKPSNSKRTADLYHLYFMLLIVYWLLYKLKR